MKINKYHVRITKRKIKALILLLFTLVIPVILNTPIFNIFDNSNSRENEQNDSFKELDVTPKLSAPLNAHYFTNYKTITIDHNQVAGSGFSNFPLLISLLDTDLRWDVQSSGNDIAFSSENIWLDHEIELFNQTYSGTQAKLVVWVRIPVLSASSDTIIRMYYGNSTMSSRQNPEGVWNSNYKAVYHMNQDPSSSNILDSTSNNYDLTTTGFTSDTRFYDGKLGTAIAFDGIDDYLYINSFSGPTNGFTFETWFKFDAEYTVGGNHMYLFSGNTPLYGNNMPRVRFYNGSTIGSVATAVDDSDSCDGTKNVWAADTWFHYTFRFSVPIQTTTLYLNGTIDGIKVDSDLSYPHSDWDRLSIASDYGSRVWGSGAISEFRVLDGPLSADWINTEYQNQNDPNSFYTVGSEQQVVVEPPNAHYFNYYKLITIDHTKITGTNTHTNFPFLISLIDYDLRFYVQPDGDDIAFSAEGDWLNHEIELFNQTFNGTHAQLIAWVQIPNLFTDKNTTLTMYYGNSTMSSRQNPTGVWNSNYVGVWHLSESSGVARDSTSYATHGTVSGGVTRGSTGQIDGTYFFNGIDSKVDMGDPADGHLDFGTGSFTVETWIYRDGTMAEGQYGGIFKGNGDVDDQNGWLFRFKETDGVRFSGGDGTASVFNIHKSSSIVDNTWIHYVGVLDRSSGNAYLYRNGHLNATDSSITSGNIDSTRTLKLSEDWSTSIHFKGLFDEIRILNVPKSSDWILTEYNNQYDPSSFYTVGQPQLVSEQPPNTIYFDHYKIITIDHTQVNGTGSHVNFPLLISLQDKDLRWDVQNDGDDIAFSMDGKWLDHQIELFNQTYNSTHAQLITWIRIPFLSTSFDTNLTMYYGNSTMNSQQSLAGVFIDYQAVWHFNESSGSGDYIKDSTSNGYDGTPYGTQFLKGGLIDGARSFSGSGDNRISINRGSEFFDGDSVFTFSFWIYPNYVSDAQWEALERRVFMKEGSVRLVRTYRNPAWDPGFGLFQADIEFETHGTEFPNVGIYNKRWTYITYCYDGNYLRTYTNDTSQWSVPIGGFPLISSTNSFYIGREFESFIGSLDEFRISNIAKSAGWVATEYNNQINPSTFYTIGDEKFSRPAVTVEVQVNAVDLYGNLIPNVNINMSQNMYLIESSLTDVNGSVLFTEILEGEYNFTATISSNIGDATELVNITSQAILLDKAFQVVNLTCNVSTNFFEIVDVDGEPLESGWIIVGNNTENLQKCIIDATGHTKFWWVNITPYDYNYTVYYQNDLYSYPNSIIPLASGDITTPNYTIPVQVNITTIEFTVKTFSSPYDPIPGAKLILRVNDTLGLSIVNLTTNSAGKATLRWLNSSGIDGNYSLQIEFFGRVRYFNETIGPADVNNISFIVNNQAFIEFRVDINLDAFRTELFKLNPTDYIKVTWGTIVKLRMLFNVSKVESGYEYLLGPRYADSMTYQLLLGDTPVKSGSFLKEEGNEGRHYATIDTTLLESDISYTITVSALKSGYTIPDIEFFQLNVLNNDLELNQSDNEDSDTSVYWLEPANMTLKSYGKNVESFTLESTLFQNLDHEFNFSIPTIENHWNLSSITFNFYNISWSTTNVSLINITIEDPYGAFYYYFNRSNHGGWDYSQGTWTGITLDVGTASPTYNNGFEFIIGGTFNAVDVIAEANFIRGSVNIQYSQFNISDTISILSEKEGWAIKNITFEIFDCYNTSTWAKVNLTELTTLNITTNDGFTYSLRDGDENGNGLLIIDEQVIYPSYPLSDHFEFFVECAPDIIFNAMIKVKYIQEYYTNQYLETLNLTKDDSGISNGGLFRLSAAESSWADMGAILWVEGIKSGSTYYSPSDVAMNITIGSTTYSISDNTLAKGTFSLIGFPKDQILGAVITTSIPVNFTLRLSLEYSRMVSYEIIGSVSYKILEAPSIYGTVQYETDLGYYLQIIDTSLVVADEYNVRFTITKNHYNLEDIDFKLIVIKRPTLLNGSTDFFRSFEQIYAMEPVNFTFVYTDNLSYQPITNVQQQTYIWEQYDEQGQVIKTGQGNLISVGDSYVLDIDTEKLTLGEYLIVVTLDKDNYDYKNGMITLTILERPTLINGASQLSPLQENIYVGQELTFSFSYVDVRTNTNITTLSNQTYIWKQIDSEGATIKTGSGSLTLNANYLYILDINTELLRMGEYVIDLTLDKENYTAQTGTIFLTILERPTLINGLVQLPIIQTEIYVGEELNFTFSYVDFVENITITNLSTQSYTWEQMDEGGLTIDSGQANLTFNADNLYVLDFDTEIRSSGSYELIVTLNKENYTLNSATILLTISKRIFGFSLSDNFRNFQINVVKGKLIPIEINITDLTQNNKSLTGAVVLLRIRDLEYQFEEISNGTYKLMFPTNDIDAFFTSKTLRGIINLSKEGYNSKELSVTIVVEMEEIFPGMPTFYFILALSIIATFTVSIAAYRIYKYIIIPKFVRNVRAIKKAIEKGKDISESLLYRSKEVFIGERVKDKWDKAGLSFAKIFGITLEKETAKRKINVDVIRRTQKPIGLILMKWDEKIGTEILSKYPDDLDVSEKTLLQIYGTHEYSGEKGIVTLTVGTTNILSYYTGPEKSFYLLLFLNLDDDPDLYEDGMANTISTILENLKDDSYLQMIPYLFQRISLYPSLNDEEILTLHYQDEIKRFIIKMLQEDGVIIKSELSLWLRDKGLVGFLDLDSILLELTKKDIIKQFSIKGLPSSLIVLANDLFMLRVPPVKLLENPVSQGLPTQFKKTYLADVKKFFQDYSPTEEDNLNIIEIFTNPQAYETLRLLRTAIVTIYELEKLKVKGVEDIYGILKLLYDNQLIKVFKDENNNEYFALLSDFYMDLIFPKYILGEIKKSYEQKSKANTVLIEYLNILEESYLKLKKQKK